MDESVDSVKLQEIFQQFGNIVSCKLAMFDDGKSKEYGFVQFESEESANAAIEKLNGVIVGGKQMYVHSFIFSIHQLVILYKISSLMFLAAT